MLMNIHWAEARQKEFTTTKLLRDWIGKADWGSTKDEFLAMQVHFLLQSRLYYNENQLIWV